MRFILIATLLSSSITIHAQSFEFDLLYEVVITGTYLIESDGNLIMLSDRNFDYDYSFDEFIVGRHFYSRGSTITSASTNESVATIFDRIELIEVIDNSSIIVSGTYLHQHDSDFHYHTENQIIQLMNTVDISLYNTELMKTIPDETHRFINTWGDWSILLDSEPGQIYTVPHQVFYINVDDIVIKIDASQIEEQSDYMFFSLYADPQNEVVIFSVDCVGKP